MSNATIIGETGDAALAAALSMLPPERFPLTSSVARELTNYGSDSQYQFALRQLIAGVGSAARSTS